MTATAAQRAAAVLQARMSWPQADACAEDLANAGLLGTGGRDLGTLRPGDVDMPDVYQAVGAVVAALGQDHSMTMLLARIAGALEDGETVEVTAVQP